MFVLDFSALVIHSIPRQTNYIAYCSTYFSFTSRFMYWLMLIKVNHKETKRRKKISDRTLRLFLHLHGHRDVNEVSERKLLLTNK